MTACALVDDIQPTAQSAPSAQMEPASPIEPEPASVQDTTGQPQNGLSTIGPWLLLSTESGLWAMNEDGSHLTQLTEEVIFAPAELNAAISQNNSYVAYITANDRATLQGLILKIISLPEGKLEHTIPLTVSENEPQPEHEMCDPKYEAARAITIGNSIAWSPDGTQLAFIGSLQGSSADVYLYSLSDESITRLSEETTQTYDLHWAPGGKNLIYFSATCFGTGAGFNMDAVWALRPNEKSVTELYKTDEQSWGESFIGWGYGESESFYVATISGCPYKNLRMVDIESKMVAPIHTECFDDVTTGPTGMLAVITSSDFSDQPGLYIYGEHLAMDKYIPEPNGRSLQFDTCHILYSVAGNQGPEIHSFNICQAGDYYGKGDFPVFFAGGERWVWNEGGSFHLSGNNINAPVVLSKTPAFYPFAITTGNQQDGFHDRLFFSSNDNLYMAVAPDYQPIPLVNNLRLLSPPVLVWR
jgi:hypothetical protein